jgi:hypothetical protein
MPNTTITRYGLDYATSASTIGTLIAPIYFVPVYDYRIDSLIHDNIIPTSAFSACVNVSATEPTGEILWNTSAADYSLSDINESFIISAQDAVSAGNQILNPVQSQKWQINLKNGIPLSNHWAGTSATFDPDGGPAWNISDDTVLSAGSNATPSGLDKYFSVIDYYPVSADTEDSKIRGMVKCRLAKNIGECKFNKVALYCVRQDVYGNIINEEPAFFAECQLKTTVVKTNISNNGFDDVTVDVQLDLHSLSADWADVFFSTSGDYWARVPGGLYYPEKIGVGEFDGDTTEPQATVHIRPQRGSTNVKLIRWERGRNYITRDVADTGITEDRLYNYNLSASNGTQMEILDAGHGTVAPLSASSMDLGKNAVRFRNGYLSEDLYVRDVYSERDVNAVRDVNASVDVNAENDVNAGNDIYAVNNIRADGWIIGQNLSAALDTYTRDVYAGRDVNAVRDVNASVDVNAENDVNAGNDIYAVNDIHADGNVSATDGHFTGNLELPAVPDVEDAILDLQNSFSAGSFSATTDGLSVEQIITIHFTINQDVVFLSIPAFSGTINYSNLELIPGTNMPADLRPVNNQYCTMIVQQGGSADMMGYLKITQSSNFIFAWLDAGVFNESFTRYNSGTRAQTITYYLQ